MTTRSNIPLRGDHNQCPGCGEMFNSTAAFEKHRTGPMDARRCLTPSEMRARGMAQANGWWVTKLREQAA